MNEPNSILEFLGILLVMGIFLAIVITLFFEGMDKIKKPVASISKNNNIKESNIKEQRQSILSDSQKMKYQINSMFYDYCFSKEIANYFLTDNKFSQNIVLGLILYQYEEEMFLEKVLKSFFKKKYKFELGESSYHSYTINGYKFIIDEMRIEADKPNSFYEILNNNFENVRDLNNMEVLIAEEFYLYCEEGKPKAIFVIIYNPKFKKYFIRRVFEDGQSLILKEIINYNSTEAFDFIRAHANDKTNFN